MTVKFVTKRSGEKEAFDISKVLRWELWACKGLKAFIDWQDILIKAKEQFTEGMSTQNVQLRLIDECNNRMTHAHSLVAGRLYTAYIAKKIHGEPYPLVKDLHTQLIKSGYMSSNNYTAEEYEEVQAMIDHSKNFEMTYIQIRQLIGKYSLADRTIGTFYETPQFSFMRMAMALSEDEPDRMKHVRKFYNFFSDFKIAAPTPNYVNLGTRHNGYISCCLYTVNDTAESLAIGDHIAYTMTYMSAGIGGFINTRSIGDKVKEGVIKHMGKLPYMKSVAAAVNANQQNCYSDQTEILTENGFFLFSELKEGVKVAQVHNGGTIDFVLPEEIIAKDYAGPMYRFASHKKMGVDIHVTPNHRMAWRKGVKANSDLGRDRYSVEGNDSLTLDKYYVSSDYEITSAEEFFPVRENILDFGGKAVGDIKGVTLMDCLNIAYMANGSKKAIGDHVYEFRLTKERKIDRLEGILNGLNIAYAKNTFIDGVTIIYTKADLELKKDFNSYNLSDKGATWAEEFLREVVFWGGNLSTEGGTDSARHCTTNPKLNQFLQALCAMCGAYSHEVLVHPKKEHHSVQYNLYISFNRPYTTGRDIDKIVTQYNGKVYCVTVPSGLIVTRHNGVTAVCGNSRGGAATQYFSIYDPEAVDLIYLQNPRTPISKQNREIHFAVQFNDTFLEKVFKNEKVFSFNVKTAPELMALMFKGDKEAFLKEYTRLENDPTFEKKYISAKELGLMAARQSHEVATLYQINMDEVNRHTPFKDPIHSSNLCLEIVQPTSGYESMLDLYSTEPHERGEVSLCALAGIVPTNVADEEYEEVAYYSLLMIDKCIHKNSYIFPHLEYTAKSRMNAGVGIVGLAYDMAKHNLKYSSVEGLHHIHKVGERHAYNLIKASIRLGKEKGNAPWMHKTKWPEGWLPIDTYKKSVDTGMDFKNLYDWEGLRTELIANGGMRNSCLISYQPTESSSKAVGLPNGVYPVRGIYAKKTDGSSAVDFIAPYSDTLGSQYELAYSIHAEKMFHVYGVLQKFTDQAISADIYSDRTDSPELKASKLLDELYHMYKYGVKTRYYTNSKTTKSIGLEDVEDDRGCGSGACTL